MCVGALLESDVGALVYAVPNIVDGAAGTVIQLAQHPACAGASRSSAASARPRPRSSSPGTGRRSRRSTSHRAGPGRRGRSRPGPEPLWYPPPRRGVRVVEGAALEKRCAQAPWVRIPPSPPSSLGPVDSRRGRLVAYGAALEMRFGATRRGFESPPLRQHRLPRQGHARIGTGRPAPLPCYNSAAVLGGELAVPCTCNPLQQG